MMYTERLTLTILALTLAASVGLTGCTQANRTGEVGERPETEQAREGGESVATRTGMETDREGGMLGGAAADIHDLQNAHNDLRKSVTDLRISARQGDRERFVDQSNAAFDRLETSLNDLAQAAVEERTGEQPVSERGPMGGGAEPALPPSLRQQLDQMRNLPNRDNQSVSNIQDAQQRWRLVADTLQGIQQEIGGTGAKVTGVQEIRQMAGQISANNQLTQESKLFDTTERTVQQLVRAIEDERLNMIPAGGTAPRMGGNQAMEQEQGQGATTGTAR